MVVGTHAADLHPAVKCIKYIQLTWMVGPTEQIGPHAANSQSIDYT